MTRLLALCALLLLPLLARAETEGLSRLPPATSALVLAGGGLTTAPDDIGPKKREKIASTLAGLIQLELEKAGLKVSAVINTDPALSPEDHFRRQVRKQHDALIQLFLDIQSERRTVTAMNITLHFYRLEPTELEGKQAVLVHGPEAATIDFMRAVKPDGSPADLIYIAEKYVAGLKRQGLI
jgi:hypothetical protein